MKKAASFFSNTILATMFLLLVLLPVGVVGGIGGIGSRTERGTALGAKLNEQGGTLSETRNGEIKELSFTTFWGRRASYENILGVKNTSTLKKEYQLEILEIRGTKIEKQDILVYFQENGMPKVALEAGKTAWVNLGVTTPEDSEAALRTQTTLKIAIWEH